jgi:hypothetical protein
MEVSHSFVVWISRHRAALPVKKLCLNGIALFMVLVAARVHGQPDQPTINFQNSVGSSNLLFQLPTQAGWFYTFQQSADLANWSYLTNSFGDGTTLNWTNSMATNGVNFYRVTVNAPNTTILTNYHSWNNSISLNNGIVEAVIVPTIGRVQQFRFLGDTNNAFFEDSTLYGQTPATNTYKGWGADKAWPAAQNSWLPTWPPTNFDRMTQTGAITNGVVTMTSQVDSTFGIRITRVIQLLFNEPVMQIQTTFDRVATPARTLINSNIAVWIDCQANVSMSSRCYVPVPSPSIFVNGYTTTGDAFFGPAFTTNFTSANGLISFGPDSARSHKLGFDSGTLVLVGTNISLRIDAPRVPGATYTAGGCSTEVYTAQYSSSTPFFELECLSPAPTLPVGGKITYVTTYSLFHRTGATTDAEAQKVLAWQY